MKLGSVVQEEMSFKIFLIWTSGDPPVQWSVTIYAILKEGNMGNIHVKLYVIRTRCRLKKKFTDGRMDDGRRSITIAHLEPSAQVI